MPDLNSTSQSYWNSYQFFWVISFIINIQVPVVWCRASICIFIFIIVSFGLLGNGTIIWLLGFHIKWNAFTTYILKLAFADFRLVLYLTILEIVLLQEDAALSVALGSMFVSSCTLELMYNMGQLLLTTISIDRCVAVHFPIWHRCHHPPSLSIFICVLLWLLSFVISVINVRLVFQGHGPLLRVLVHVLICYPLMAASTLTLLVKIRYKQHNRQRTKTLTVILLTLLFFLLFSLPGNLSTLITYYCMFGVLSEDMAVDICLQWDISESLGLMLCILWCMGVIGVVLSSSINPMLYFLVGKEKNSQSGLYRVKAALQVFQDVEDQRQEEQTQVQTPLGSL
ncbi:mas-related G-protein coupled receptor member H-like [Varanus komodoensis]|uniref:mas-related G-protein coupled receptor member H-like n=1 Tax=Varanus komodoensis TaxID=61221 RepID=UPI001CF7E7E8|nr:mas-related G-protein coupled receptor member H-like [Varanus komodoensis]